MIQKRFLTLIATIIITTVPLHSAQKTFMDKWIVEPSSAILKSKNTWAFAIGAALCCAAYKGYKRAVKDTAVIQQAHTLLSEEYYVLPPKIGTIQLNNERHVRSEEAKQPIIDYTTTELMLDGFNPRTDKVCTCKIKLSVSDRLCRVLQVRERLLNRIYTKLQHCNPLVRIWYQQVKGISMDVLRARVLAQENRTKAIRKVLKKDDVKKAINSACTYRGTTNPATGCVSVYCLK